MLLRIEMQEKEDEGLPMRVVTKIYPIIFDFKLAEPFVNFDRLFHDGDFFRHRVWFFISNLRTISTVIRIVMLEIVGISSWFNFPFIFDGGLSLLTSCLEKLVLVGCSS